jgi:hypothetical protein
MLLDLDGLWPVTGMISNDTSHIIVLCYVLVSNGVSWDSIQLFSLLTLQFIAEPNRFCHRVASGSWA